MKLEPHQSIASDKLSKPEIEQVEQQKQEYKLIEQYIRSKGMIMYAYNPLKDEIKEIKPIVKKDVALVVSEEGTLIKKEEAKEEVMVDPRNIFFEALNSRNAIKRVNKYKQGKIKELCNLIRKQDKKPILPW
ncbi:hypothetical protein COY27_01160 [Candidatus Woesearchaeota archaeon CG_4_10_14_0_2_um_filter_33_13]|nr:MAG: hypothetical protein COY27_01160 [Candidatus Woesearchaeota archaeon CG_4_10_14_0_2_um_filter_33_13]